MVALESLHLNNLLLFKDLYWQMDEHPFTVIRGKNLDRKIDSNNAVGKSLLPSAMVTLLNDAPPIASKQKSSKDLIKGKSSTTLTLTNDKDHWSLNQFAKANSVKYGIIKNGTDLQIKDIAKARIAIRKAFPLDEENLFSQVYLSRYRPSSLLYGKPSARFDFFERIFDMRIYDLMHKNYLSQLSKLNAKFEHKKLLENKRSELDVNSKPVGELLKKVRQKHKDLLQEYKISNRDIHNLSAYVSIAEEIKSELSVNDLKHKYKQKKNQLDKINKKIDVMHEARGAVQYYTKLKITRKKLEKRLTKLQKYNVEKLEIKSTKLSVAIDNLENMIEEYNNVEKHIKIYHSTIKKFNEIPSDIEEDYKKSEEHLLHIEHNLKQKSKLKAGDSCPTCGIVIPDEFAQDLKKLKSKVATSREKLKHKKLMAYCAKVREKIPHNILYMSLEVKHTKLQKIRNSIKLIDKKIIIGRDYNKTKDQLNSLPKLKKTERYSFSELKLLKKEQVKLIKSLELMKSDIKLKHKLAELEDIKDDLPTAQKKLLQAKNFIAKMSPMIEKISDRMHDLAVKNAEYKINSQRLQEIDSELDEIKNLLEDKIIVEELSRAYSAKGIRIMQIQSLANAYINALNELSGAVYSESVKFFSDIDINKFNIIAERSKQIGDIRSLCGSESGQYLCISALALQKLMPSHLRCSHIFLDEMEGGLSPADRDMFCRDFLPTLAGSIPHLVVITALSAKEFSPLNAINKTLVRKNGITNWLN